MNDIQKQKRDFRTSKIWKLFRKTKMNEQNGICFLSGRKLAGKWNLHHRLHSTAYAEEHYSDISKPENYIAINKMQHDLLHSLIYGYIKYGREEYLKRMIDEVHYEVEINGL